MEDWYSEKILDSLRCIEAAVERAQEIAEYNTLSSMLNITNAQNDRLIKLIKELWPQSP